MTRQPVRDLAGPASIIGVASPVNTYVRPADPAPSPLHGIAEGLASLSDGLGGLIAKRKQEGEDADKQRAEALFNQNNQVGWAEAVRTGKVPANSSPVFMRSYKEAEGALAGVQLKEKWFQAYTSWEGRGRNDPEEFKKFYRDFVAANITTTDPDVLRGLNPYVASLTQESYGLRTNEVNGRVTKGRLDTSQALVNSAIDAAGQEGAAAGKVDYDKLWGSIEAEYNDAFSNGSSAEDLSKRLIESITLKAVEMNDPGLLKLLDRTLPGMEVPLKDLQEGAQGIAQAENAMSTTARQAMIDADRKQEKADKAREAALTMEIHRTLQGDPNADVEELTKQLEVLNPKARSEMKAWREALQEGLVVEDASEIVQMRADILTGQMDQRDIIEAMRAGKIGSSFSSLIDLEEQYVTKRARGGGIGDTTSGKFYRNAIADLFADQTAPFLRDLNGNPQGLPAEAIQAIEAYNLELLRWEDANPNASPLEKEQAVQDIGNRVMGLVNTANPEANTPATFDTPQDLQKKGMEEAKEKGVDGEAAPVIDEEDAKTIYDSATEPPMLDTLPDAYLKEIETRATEFGVTPEELNREAWKVYRKKFFGEEPLDTLRPDESAPAEGEIVEPPEQGDIGFGDAIDSAYADTAGDTGDQNAAIRQLLSRVEGSTDPNATLANGLLTGGDVDLVNMSVQEVLALQDQMLAHPDNRWNSSAVGMPQVVAKTLRSLVDEGAVGMQDTFNEDTQVRIMDALLERRGLSKWRAGEMSDDEFIKELGDEWQSIAQGKASKEEIISALNSGRQQPKGQGLMDLVSSSKRGYQPDLKNLKPELAQGVSDLQKAWGRDLPIVSGFRDVARNKKAKGATKSQHIHGNAVDIDVSNLTKQERIDLIRMASEKGFKGIGVYANSLHLDYGNRRAWGPTHHDDSIPAWAKAVIEEHNSRNA